MTGQADTHTAGDLTMVATVGRFCVRRHGWMLAACVLLVVAGILTAGAEGSLGHPAAMLPAYVDLWAALRKLLAVGPHW
jgi:hypothetical protein